MAELANLDASMAEERKEENVLFEKEHKVPRRRCSLLSADYESGHILWNYFEYLNISLIVS